MDLSSFLRPNAVRVMAGTASKKRLFQDLGDIAQAVYGLDSAATLDALQEPGNSGADRRGAWRSLASRAVFTG